MTGISDALKISQYAIETTLYHGTDHDFEILSYVLIHFEIASEPKANERTLLMIVLLKMAL